MADKLGGIFPDAQRKLEFQTSKGGGVDLDDTGIFKFQCKNYQNYVSISTIEEVKVTSHHDIPVLVTKGNKQPPMAVLPFDKFVYLLSIVYGLEAPLALIQPEGLERFVEAIAGTLPDPGLIKLVNHDALRVAWEETKSPTGNYLDSLI